MRSGCLELIIIKTSLSSINSLRICFSLSWVVCTSVSVFSFPFGASTTVFMAPTVAVWRPIDAAGLVIFMDSTGRFTVGIGCTGRLASGLTVADFVFEEVAGVSSTFQGLAVAVHRVGIAVGRADIAWNQYSCKKGMLNVYIQTSRLDVRAAVWKIVHQKETEGTRLSPNRTSLKRKF